MHVEAIEVESAGEATPPSGLIFGEPIARWRERTRRELGLSDRPDVRVTGAGHQPFLWHPGILAKFVHARRLGGATGQVVHLVVDHDIFDPSIVRVPVRVGDDALSIDAITHRFGPSRAGASAMSLPAFEPVRYAGPAPACASVQDGLARAHAALVDARAQAPNAAMQVAIALSALMERWAGPTRIVADSRLLQTTLGKAFVEAMRRDPGRCARAFNEALALDSRAARPLRIGTDPELPLWKAGADGQRERVTAAQLTESAPDAHWLPRAFLLSAFMRLGVCDRFVHGTGARRYERVTEAWMRAWLDVELPPIDIASATLRLPLMGNAATTAPLVTLDERRNAWWNPESLDSASQDTHPGPAKRAMLDALASLPRGSPERRARYQRMLKELDALRHERSSAFVALDARLAADRARARAMRLAQDRSWPFVYFTDAALDAAFAHSEG